ncbi:MAG: hypothetical protein SchgKO_18690 [Schleiferiaceae bacterium]
MKTTVINALSKSFAALFLGAFLVGCNSSTEGDATAEDNKTQVETSSQEGESVMYQPSELASLMRKMYEDNQKLKAQVENGEIPESFPEDFYTIHTAEATDPSEINETFKAFAEVYLSDMEAIIASDSTTVTAAYNKMVSTCISCHQVYCQGPIPKIKKLYIPEVPNP